MSREGDSIKLSFSRPRTQKQSLRLRRPQLSAVIAEPLAQCGLNAGNRFLTSRIFQLTPLHTLNPSLMSWFGGSKSPDDDPSPTGGMDDLGSSPQVLSSDPKSLIMQQIKQEAAVNNARQLITVRHVFSHSIAASSDQCSLRN